MPPADPSSPQAAPKPVFVDDTGRRHRVVRLVGWVVGGLTLAYLALLGVSLVGSPGLVPLSLPAIGSVLPGPSAPHIGTATKINRGGPAPAAVSHDASAGTGTGPGTPGPQTTAAPRLATTRPRPAGTPAPSVTASTATLAPHGNPSPAGTPRASRSPGPKSSHGSPHYVRGTPTPAPSPT